MGSKQDLTGKRFGRLTAIKPVGIASNGSIMWKCRCDCGNHVSVRTAYLNCGKTKSCGKCRPPVIEKIKKFKDTVTFEDIDKIEPFRSTTGYADIYSIKQPDNVIFRVYIHVLGERVYLGQRKTLFEAIKLQEEALKLLIEWSEENGKQNEKNTKKYRYV